MTGLASALTATASGEETHRCILTKERASAGRKRRMDEIGKYRKRKKQKSKSENRSDHKHEYERTILMRVNSVNNHIDGYSWSTHCKICGRLGKKRRFARRRFPQTRVEGKISLVVCGYVPFIRRNTEKVSGCSGISHGPARLENGDTSQMKIMYDKDGNLIGYFL